MGIRKPYIIGMIHLPPTISYDGWPGMELMLEKAVQDLQALEKGGIDAALMENDGDSPCQVEGRADVVVPMTVVAYELKRIAKIPLGVEVLLNDPKASITIAKMCRLHFIRTDYFVDRMERGGYGTFFIDPKGLMRFRENIQADDIHVYADVQVKYAKMIEKKPISLSVRDAIDEGAEGVIVSGDISGEKPRLEDLKNAVQVADGRVPVIIGSGFSVSNAGLLMRYADWAIVGNSIKTSGFVDRKKVTELVKEVRC